VPSWIFYTVDWITADNLPVWCSITHNSPAISDSLFDHGLEINLHGLVVILWLLGLTSNNSFVDFFPFPFLIFSVFCNNVRGTNRFLVHEQTLRYGQNWLKTWPTYKFIQWQRRDVFTCQRKFEQLDRFDHVAEACVSIRNVRTAAPH